MCVYVNRYVYIYIYLNIYIYIHVSIFIKTQEEYHRGYQKTCTYDLGTCTVRLRSACVHWYATRAYGAAPVRTVRTVHHLHVHLHHMNQIIICINLRKPIYKGQ